MKNEGKIARKFFHSTIKKHKWWDYYFFYDMIIRLLQYREINWHKSHYIGWEKDLENIKKARKYFTLLRDDDFLEVYAPNKQELQKCMKQASKNKTRIKRKAFLLLYKELEKWWD